MSNCLTWEPISDLEEPDLYHYLVYLQKSESSFFSWLNLKIQSLYITKMCIVRFIFGQSFAGPITA